MKMCASMPAAAAYAASAPPALPAVGIATFWMPSSRHIDTAQESPRALNEPVGLTPSSFSQRLSHSTRSAEAVQPVQRRPAFLSETMFSARRTGSSGA